MKKNCSFLGLIIVCLFFFGCVSLPGKAYFQASPHFDNAADAIAGQNIATGRLNLYQTEQTLLLQQLAQAVSYGKAQEDQYQATGDPDGLIREIDGQKVYRGHITNYSHWRYTLKIFETISGMLVQVHDIGGGDRLDDVWLPPGNYTGVLYNGSRPYDRYPIEINPSIVKTTDGKKIYWFFKIDENSRY